MSGARIRALAPHELPLALPHFGSAAGTPRFSHSLSPIALIFSMCAPGLLGRSASGPFLSWANPFRLTAKNAASAIAQRIIQSLLFVLGNRTFVSSVFVWRGLLLRTDTRPQHRHQRLRVSQPVIRADLD